MARLPACSRPDQSLPLGDVILPYLEAHVFGFVRDATTSNERPSSRVDLQLAPTTSLRNVPSGDELRVTLEQATDRDRSSNARPSVGGDTR